jgi:hypothetical protein
VRTCISLGTGRISEYRLSGSESNVQTNEIFQDICGQKTKKLKYQQLLKCPATEYQLPRELLPQILFCFNPFSTLQPG